MTGPRPDRPQRVRVTGPARRTTPARAAGLDTSTPLGTLYLRSLLREQLRLAARVLGALAVLIGGLPLLFVLAPGLAGVTVAGLPLPWLLLGGGVYPVLVLLGWVYVRRAERNERAFAELVQGSLLEEEQ